MQLQEELLGDVCVLTIFEQRIDSRSAPELRATVERISLVTKKVVLDLSRVSFVDSSGLGAIVASMKAVRGAGDLALAGAHASVTTLLRLTRMDKVFRQFPTVDLAVQAFGVSRS